MRAGAIIEEEDSMLNLRRFTETAIAAIATGPVPFAYGPGLPYQRPTS